MSVNNISEFINLLHSKVPAASEEQELRSELMVKKINSCLASGNVEELGKMISSDAINCSVLFLAAITTDNVHVNVLKWMAGLPYVLPASLVLRAAIVGGDPKHRDKLYYLVKPSGSYAVEIVLAVAAVCTIPDYLEWVVNNLNPVFCYDIAGTRQLIVNNNPAPDSAELINKFEGQFCMPVDLSTGSVYVAATALKYAMRKLNKIKSK